MVLSIIIYPLTFPSDGQYVPSGHFTTSLAPLCLPRDGTLYCEDDKSYHAPASCLCCEALAEINMTRKAVVCPYPALLREIFTPFGLYGNRGDLAEGSGGLRGCDVVSGAGNPKREAN